MLPRDSAIGNSGIVDFDLLILRPCVRLMMRSVLPLVGLSNSGKELLRSLFKVRHVCVCVVVVFVVVVFVVVVVVVAILSPLWTWSWCHCLVWMVAFVSFVAWSVASRCCVTHTFLLWWR